MKHINELLEPNILALQDSVVKITDHCVQLVDVAADTDTLDTAITRFQGSLALMSHLHEYNEDFTARTEVSLHFDPSRIPQGRKLCLKETFERCRSTTKLPWPTEYGRSETRPAKKMCLR